VAAARPLTMLREFLRQEAAGGVLLVLAAAFALVLANSPAAPAYTAALHLPVVVRTGGIGLDEPLLHWINDGLMAVFFLLVGLEIKREPLGIALGLFLGKQVGVAAATWAAVRLNLGTLPDGVGWRRFHGMAVLCGIGFTMSLFIGSLAFRDPLHAAEVRLGVLSGSILSALLGYALLRTAPARQAATPRPAHSLVE
jgi:Na+/H+ antiporter NhaA